MAVVYNHFPQIAAGLKPACQKAANDTADFVRDTAQSIAPVRSGYMQENIYSVHTDGTSSYSSGTVQAPGDSYLLPEKEPQDDMTALAASAANYSIYVEYGTRYMAAQPFMTPAFEMGRRFYDGKLAKIFPEIAGNIT